MKTFWLKHGAGKATSGISSSARSSMAGGVRPVRKLDAKAEQKSLEKTDRLIRWNVAELSELLKKVMAARATKNGNIKVDSTSSHPEAFHAHNYRIPLDLVKDVIIIPDFDLGAATSKVSADDIQLEDDVFKQLDEFVREVAALYRPNPFHK